jgi:hypothetical protein
MGALDASVGDARDQTRQGPGRVGRVEEDALGAGRQLHRVGCRQRERGVAGTDLAAVDP